MMRDSTNRLQLCSVDPFSMRPNQSIRTEHASTPRKAAIIHNCAALLRLIRALATRPALRLATGKFVLESLQLHW
jgi:hypothetical protein